MVFRSELSISSGTSVKGEARDLAALRDTLLPKLLSGGIRVVDAQKIVEAAP
ncbi:hypothetical protein LCGC14_2679670 [marine sediment metagenome]|uniref:Uncharacterized protein n=1 Tax=marine sediment metagenome TaxID=412755 RepID=A0A0F9A9B9_9ZZZZ